MFKRAPLAMAIALTALLAGCRTVSETDQPDRPWYHTTLYHEAIPWPWPVGDLGMIDYHNAHGAGWWDAPWVLAEQFLLFPTYLSYGLGETLHTELMGGSPDYDRTTWQWKAVNWTLGPIHAVLSTVNYALIWAGDTVGHDPIAALWWMMERGETPAAAAEEPSP